MEKIKIASKGMPVYQDFVYKGIFTRDIYQGELILNTDFQYADGTFPGKGEIVPHFVIDSLNPHNCKQDTIMETREILADREKTHGDYGSHAAITQALKDIMRSQVSWDSLPENQRETLEMIAHKIGRILAGDPDFRDHWADIAGYATLSADRCSK